MKRTTFSQQAIRFAVTGVLNTGIDFLVFAVLVFHFNLNIILANALSFLCAVSFSFVVNGRWTFRNRPSGHGRASRWIRFMVISIAGLGLGTAILYFLVPAIPVLLAKCLAVAATFLWNFTLVRTFVWDS